MDRFNVDADDVRTPTRQAEIEALVEQLATFSPTKVAVEKRWQDSTTLAKYQAYRRGDHELTPDETEQIGFRLARRPYLCDIRVGTRSSAARSGGGAPRVLRGGSASVPEVTRRRSSR